MKEASKKGEREKGKDWSGARSRSQRKKLIGIK